MVRKQKWDNVLGWDFSPVIITFRAIFGTIGKPNLCTFRITPSFLKYVKI